MSNLKFAKQAVLCSAGTKTVQTNIEVKLSQDGLVKWVRGYKGMNSENNLGGDGLLSLPPPPHFQL